MTKIAFIGDIHGDTRSASYSMLYARDHDAERVFFVGDFGWQFDDGFLTEMKQIAERFDYSVEFIDGNHENFDVLYDYDIEPDGYRHLTNNVLHIPRGTAMQIDGIDVLFIGGASSIDRHYRMAGLEWWPQELITSRDIDKALDVPNVDVVVSHETPWLPKLSNKNNEDEIAEWGYDFAEAIETSRQQRELLHEILDVKRPLFWYHGHHHNRSSYNYQDCDFTCLSRDGDAVSDRVAIVDTQVWKDRKEDRQNEDSLLFIEDLPTVQGHGENR